MPTPHRRIGLVIDEDMDIALEIFRTASRSGIPEASLARRAVFQGTVIEALMRAVSRGAADQERAAASLRELREVLPTLGLPPAVADDLARALGRATEGRGSEDRKLRQLALLASPDPHGREALEYADDFDAHDALPD